ncbi:MAG: acetyltransferase [Bacillota bacterium]|jgi:ribosomal protein S18 acetylase RimI-like enzyme|nr:acetyltransferase [Bacillota bacterium]
MELLIRQASIEDLDRLNEIEQICFPPMEAASRDSLKFRLMVYGPSFQLAEFDSRIIGFINGSIINDMVIHDEHYGDTSYHDPNGEYQSIFGLCMLPEYRKSGYASALVKALIKTAADSGRKGLTLCCKEEKIPYYEKLGFVNHGRSASDHGGAVWYNMIFELN